jgi:hypothetical protein
MVTVSLVISHRWHHIVVLNLPKLLQPLPSWRGKPGFCVNLLSVRLRGKQGKTCFPSLGSWIFSTSGLTLDDEDEDFWRREKSNKDFQLRERTQSFTAMGKFGQKKEGKISFRDFAFFVFFFFQTTYFTFCLQLS